MRMFHDLRLYLQRSCSHVCRLLSYLRFLSFQIGLAVGDIEAVQKNAELKRLKTQVINNIAIIFPEDTGWSDVNLELRNFESADDSINMKRCSLYNCYHMSLTKSKQSSKQFWYIFICAILIMMKQRAVLRIPNVVGIDCNQFPFLLSQNRGWL